MHQAIYLAFFIALEPRIYKDEENILPALKQLNFLDHPQRKHISSLWLPLSKTVVLRKTHHSEHLLFLWKREFCILIILISS